jgi:hypothetical protein
MGRLALRFKGRLLSVHPIDRPRILVGHLPDCDIPIDSLAVAPRHLEIRREPNAVMLTALDADFRVFLNGRRVEVAVLNDGDRIQVGKHTLGFSGTKAALSVPQHAARRQARKQGPAPAVGGPVPAYLQIQSGAQIGRVIALPRGVTRLSRRETDRVLVARLRDGYLLARAGERSRVSVDRAPVVAGAPAALNNGSLIEIDGTHLRFYCQS